MFMEGPCWLCKAQNFIKFHVDVRKGIATRKPWPWLGLMGPGDRYENWKARTSTIVVTSYQSIGHRIKYIYIIILLYIIVYNYIYNYICIIIYNIRNPFRQAPNRNSGGIILDSLIWRSLKRCMKWYIYIIIYICCSYLKLIIQYDWGMEIYLW